MTTLETNYSNDRAAYVNDANHYNGNSGYHQHTGTMYRDSKPAWTYNSSNDYYNYYYGGNKK